MAKDRTPTAGGIKRPDVTTGAYDPVKHRIAKKATGASNGMFNGKDRNAGMMLDNVQTTQPYTSGFYLDAYRTSYANGLDRRSGTYDVPTYFVTMNEQNGGVLYWPVTLQEKYSWYRYWARCFTSPNVLVTRADGTEAPLYSFKPGDRLFNALGKEVEVDEVTTQHYVGEVVRLDVEANRWNELEVTPEHPFKVLRKSKIVRHHCRVKDEYGVEHRQTSVDINFTPEWVEAKDIEEGDCLIVPSIGGDSNSLSTAKARLVGYYLAEGNVNFDRQGSPESVTWSLGSHERELLDEIKSLCLSEFGKEPSEYNYPERESCTSLRLWDREFASWVFENCGTGSRVKKLSQNLFNSDDETVKHIVGCWLNGDGSIDKGVAAGQFDGTTSSEDMAHQLYLMMVRVGLSPAKRKKICTKFSSSEYSGEIAWRIYLPPLYSNLIASYTKWDGLEKDFRHRKYNVDGNMLLPVRRILKRHYDGLIWNISTRGESYEDRTFLVYGIATHNTDAYCGRALELLSDLPMSKLTLNMPKMEGKDELRKEIQEFFTYQMEVLGMFELCQDILWEWNMIGNVYIFHEWDDKKKMWSRVQMLPPEEVYVFEYPFDNGNKRVEYRPERLISIIKGAINSDYGTPNGQGPTCDYGEIQANIVKNIPKEIVKMVQDNGCIVMDSDPTTGSFVHHIARRKSRYHDLGASVLERVLVPMLQKEHYRYTQLSLASRNMTPKNLITAPGLLPEELDDLRTQVDLSYLDPDYSIITNYEVTWEQIGAQDRLLQLDSEYERIENQVFAALGVTRELLTGEGSFSGNKITVEILNTMFLLTREILKNYIEKKLFLPVCEAHGWYEEGKNGIKKYFCPSIGFNRLTIRDNAEVFDSLFQLYQKGSLDIDLIYELFNINSDEVAIKLYEQLFTIKDSTFNRMLEEVHTEMGRQIPEKSDILDRFLEYLNLSRVEPEGEDGGGDDAGGFNFGGDSEDTSDSSEPNLDDIATEVANAVPAGTSDEEIFDIIDKVTDDDT